METQIHASGDSKILEVLPGEIVLRTPQDALELMHLPGTEDGKLILHQTGIAPEFFDLNTRFAGEVLQKFVNYRTQLAIVGDFEQQNASFGTSSFWAFVTESNRGQHVCFVPTVQAALERLGRLEKP